MSKAYFDKYGKTKISREEMRAFLAPKFEYHPDGKPVYTTVQGCEKECDVNMIIKTYTKEDLIRAVQGFEYSYGDLTGDDFKSFMDSVIGAKDAFMKLPSKTRAFFENDPGKMLTFMEDPNNRAKAIELGMIDEKTPANLDGLGEHVNIPPAALQEALLKLERDKLGPKVPKKEKTSPEPKE